MVQGPRGKRPGKARRGGGTIMSTHVARRPDESGAFRAHEHAETPPRLRFEEVEAFSRERMLELLVRLTPDGYAIRLFDWLDHVPPDLRDVAVRAFRATETPRVGGVDGGDLVDYVERLRDGIRRRMHVHTM